MKRGTLFFSIMLLILFAPAICSAEWKLMEGKLFESAHGTKCYIDTKMSYTDVSSSQAPIVVFWSKIAFNGKNDPNYVKLISIGGAPETAIIEIKYRLDITRKTAAVVYVALYDAQGRILSTDEVKKLVYAPVPPDSAAESVWLMIKGMHEKGAIPK